MAKGVDITAQRAREFGIEEQRVGESDYDFRYRVSGQLRDDGHVIEAHEADKNMLYDDEGGDGPMTGVIGAMAMVLNDTDFGSKGSNKIGDEIAAGTIVKHGKPEMSSEQAMLMMMLHSK